MLREFLMAARGVETDDLGRVLLWLYIPDFLNNGTMGEI